MHKEVDHGRPSRVGLAEVGKDGYEDGQMMIPSGNRYFGGL